MFVRALLAILLTLGLLTGSPAFAVACFTGGETLAACDCCPVEDAQPEPCCAGDADQDAALASAPVRTGGADLKLVMAPELRLVSVIPDGKVAAVVGLEHRAPVGRTRPLLERLGILLI